MNKACNNPATPVQGLRAAAGIAVPGLDFPGLTALQPKQFAARIGRHVNHIYDMVEEGALTAIDLSGSSNQTDRRFLRIPFEAWRAFNPARRNTGFSEKPLQSQGADAKIVFASLDFPGRAALHPKQCAARVNCHVTHIYHLVEERALTAIDLSGSSNRTHRRRLQIPVEAWRAFINKRSTNNPTIELTNHNSARRNAHSSFYGNSVNPAKGQGTDGWIAFPGLDFPGRSTLYPHECAQKLSCSVYQIIKLIQQGELGSITIPGTKSVRQSLRVTIEAWRKFINERTTG